MDAGMNGRRFDMSPACIGLVFQLKLKYLTSQAKNDKVVVICQG